MRENYQTPKDTKPYKRSGNGVYVVQVASPPERLFYKDNQEFKPFNAGLGQFAGAFPSSNGTFTLFREALAEEGKSVFEPVVTIMLPVGSENALVVLRPIKDGEYFWRVYDYSSKSQKAGTARYINASNATMGVKLAGEISRVSPWEDKIVKLGSKDRNASIMIAVRDDGKPKVLYQNRLQIINDMRVLFLGYPAMQDGKITYRVIHRRDRIQ